MSDRLADGLRNRLFYLTCRVANRLPKGLREPTIARLDQVVIYDQVECNLINFRLGAYRSQAFLWNKSYEADMFGWLSEHVKAGDHCVDVGANIGRASIFLALLVGPNGIVDAVEPIASNCALLKRNVSVNKVCDIVGVHVACCSSSAGEVSLHVGPNSFQASLLNDFGEGEVMVKTITIDSLSSRDRPINLMKIDVEGAEAEVLKGAQLVLRNDRPKLIIEMHPPFAYEVPEILRSFGYQSYSLAGDPWSLDEVAVRASEKTGGPFHVVFLPN